MQKINQEEYVLQTTDYRIDPLGDGISSIELVRVSGSDIDIVNAARVSYGKVSATISERDKVLIKFLMDHGHTSPFEHNQLSFRVKAPIFVVRQWMRHRINSFNEISYRYVKPPLEFYIPTAWRFQDTKNKQSSYGAFQDTDVHAIYEKSVRAAFEANEQLLAAGVCREQARGVLPLATYSEFIFTCNLTALMHFIKLRTHEGAQWEIKVYAHALYKLAYPHFPVALDAFKTKYNLDLDAHETLIHAQQMTDLVG